jgi:hypothetical protein
VSLSVLRQYRLNSIEYNFLKPWRFRILISGKYLGVGIQLGVRALAKPLV